MNLFTTARVAERIFHYFFRELGNARAREK
jgi:hypothetical protein